MRLFLRRLLVVFAYLVGCAAHLWAMGALWYDLPAAPLVRGIAAAGWLIGGIVLWWRGGRIGRLTWLVAFIGLLAWWFSLAPSHDRPWRIDVARLPWAEVAGDVLTVHDIRNFQYRSSETDFEPRYETRTYRLSQLRGVDLFLTYWAGPWIAHPIFSFDFGPDGRLAFSVETRPEQGEGYATIGSVYRMFEQIYIAGDERDLVRVRTKYRSGEEVYLYPLQLPPGVAREILSGFLEPMDAIRARPRWYNAITSNCAIGLRTLRGTAKPWPCDWRLLLCGKADEMLYDIGALDRRVPFDELKRRVHINARARVVNDEANFSELIRQP